MATLGASIPNTQQEAQDERVALAQARQQRLLDEPTNEGNRNVALPDRTSDSEDARAKAKAAMLARINATMAVFK